MRYGKQRHRLLLCAMLLCVMSLVALTVCPQQADAAAGAENFLPDREIGGSGGLRRSLGVEFVSPPDSFDKLTKTFLGICKAPSGNAQVSVEGWQGARNCGDSFSITVTGGSGAVRFATSNCRVSPETGAVGDSFTVTVKGAGNYSLTAIVTDSGGIDHSCAKSGIAGKANQSPLTVKGWGDTRNYYQHFDIQVLGGNTNGEISFEADGCSVSPVTGTTQTLFTVTVTRVGNYSLTAVMAGSADYQPVYSVKQCGTAAKSSQPPIEIAGWEESARYGENFNVHISGGSTTEKLVVESTGCTLTKVSGSEYEVAITSAGPYTVMASRAGNYGYNSVSASACGIAAKAKQPSLSISGWSENKNCNDGFPIQVSGGMTDGTVYFSAIGCTVTPPNGTVQTNFTVKVDTVGSYSLTAYVDGSDNYQDVHTRTFTGTAGKATQNKLAIDGWNGEAPVGSTFDIQLVGGNGSGTTSVFTDGGCTAVLKAGETNVYTVTVTAGEGGGYGIRALKAGDASYLPSTEQSVSGRAGKGAASTLAVVGWNAESAPGESFTITLDGDRNGGEIIFEAEGCTVTPSNGGIDDIYTVTVNAEAGESYTINVNRGGTGGSHANTVRSGSVPLNGIRGKAPREGDEKMPPFDDGYSLYLWVAAGIALLFLLLLLLLIQRKKEEEERYRRRRAHR